MSWFDTHKNGGHNTYNKPKPGELSHFDLIHRPVIIDHNGVEHPIVGYTESHNYERYMARNEKVVKYGLFPDMAVQKYIPSRMEEYGTGDLSGRIDEFSPRSNDERVHGPFRDSPWNNEFRFNSPTSKDHHIARDDDENDVHVNNTSGTTPKNMKEQEYFNDEKNKRNGFTEVGSRPTYLKDQEDYYANVNSKTNGYAPPTYRVPTSNHQDKEKGNDYATRACMGPFGTLPKYEASYETSNFKPIANSPPQYNAQPKKEQGNYNQETIDSTEARRRHGKAAPGDRPGFYAEDKYSGGTIDCKEAARKYNGVLLTN